jgi:hypothetical protein
MAGKDQFQARDSGVVGHEVDLLVQAEPGEQVIDAHHIAHFDVAKVGNRPAPSAKSLQQRRGEIATG